MREGILSYRDGRTKRYAFLGNLPHKRFCIAASVPLFRKKDKVAAPSLSVHVL